MFKERVKVPKLLRTFNKKDKFFYQIQNYMFI